MDEYDARIRWSLMSEPEDPASSLISQMGAGPALAAFDEGLLHRGILTTYIPRWKERRDIEIPPTTATYIYPGHPSWPSHLADLAHGAPVGLWAEGNLDLLHQPGISIVGARTSTPYGDYVTRDLVSGLDGYVIISGGAFGIDAAAHRAALAAHQPTIMVAASGIDVPYPFKHAELINEIRERGLVLSEYPPGLRPARYRFLARNRLIAGLGQLTIVVEAGQRSGALATARRAAEIGRPVCAVPGPVTSASSQGTNQLIGEFARPVRHARDVRDILEPIQSDSALPTTEYDRLTQAEQKVSENMTSGIMYPVTRLAQLAGVSRREAVTTLHGLARRGVVKEIGTRWIKVET